MRFSRATASPRPPAGRLLWLLALVVAPAGSQPAPARLLPAQVAAVERAVTGEMTRQRIPGMSVAIATNGEVRWENGYGFSDLENFVPAKAATVYRLGSISKPITAVAVLQLAAAGRIDLDAPVQKYVPGFPQKPWPLTCRQLLGHLGGIRHYRPGEIDITRHYAALTEGLAIFKDDPLLHEPGTRYAYSTYGFNLLGCAVEAAAGQPFLPYLEAHVFRPAGMTTIRADSVADLIPNRAQGYAKTPQGDLRNSGLADTSYKIPGGGLCSTAADLARFAVAVNRGALLDPEWRARMWVEQKTREGTPTGYGLGWAVWQEEGKLRVGHGGGQQRISTYLRLEPDTGCAVAVMSNLEGASLRELCRTISAAAQGR